MNTHEMDKSSQNCNKSSESLQTGLHKQYKVEIVLMARKPLLQNFCIGQGVCVILQHIKMTFWATLKTARKSFIMGVPGNVGGGLWVRKVGHPLDMWWSNRQHRDE